MLVLIIIVVMLMVLIFLVMMVMVVVKGLGLFLVGGGALYLANPSCRASNLLVVKHAGVDDVVEVDHCVVGLDDGSRGL